MCACVCGWGVSRANCNHCPSHSSKATPSILALGWGLYLQHWLLSDSTLDINLVYCWLPASLRAPCGIVYPLGLEQYLANGKSYSVDVTKAPLPFRAPTPEPYVSSLGSPIAPTQQTHQDAPPWERGLFSFSDSMPTPLNFAPVKDLPQKNWLSPAGMPLNPSVGDRHCSTRTGSICPQHTGPYMMPSQKSVVAF